MGSEYQGSANNDAVGHRPIGNSLICALHVALVGHMRPSESEVPAQADGVDDHVHQLQTSRHPMNHALGRWLQGFR
jgi:hypothetical protein